MGAAIWAAHVRRGGLGVVPAMPAGPAKHRGQLAVHMDNVFGPAAFMQIVDILRDECERAAFRRHVFL